jgi:hypothetical protein
VHTHSPLPAGLRRILKLLPVLAGAFVLGTGITVMLLSGRPAPTGLADPDGGSVRAAAQPSQSSLAPVQASPSRTPAPLPRSAVPPVPSASPSRPTVPVPTGSPIEFSLARYLDDVGAVSDSMPSTGNLDGTGSAFSAQALAMDGARPGALITFDGVPFTWPDAAAGHPDNVTASGQTLAVNGAGRILALLVTATWGPVTGSGKVEYVDGPAQNFTLSVPDWYTGCASTTGQDVVVFTPYRNQGNGRASFTACVYYASIPLRAGSTVRGVVLPDLSRPTPTSGHGSLHIFALTIDLYGSSGSL